VLYLVLETVRIASGRSWSGPLGTPLPAAAASLES